MGNHKTEILTSKFRKFYINYLEKDWSSGNWGNDSPSGSKSPDFGVGAVSKTRMEVVGSSQKNLSGGDSNDGEDEDDLRIIR